jgi:hypothetical protein
MTFRARSIAAGLAISVALAACGGAVKTNPPAAGTAGSAPTPTPAVAAGGGGGGANRGFDCAVLITPAELDQISGFKGGTVTTTSRGDQNPTAPGYGACSFEEPAASVWTGSIGLSSGDKADTFATVMDIAKSNGGTDLPGLGVPALYVNNDAGSQVLAKSSDGVGIQIGLAWDTTETTADAVKTALQKMLQTILSRV